MIKQPKLSSFYGPNAEVYSAQDYEALAARLAEVEKDAERYRWLKSLSARSLSCGVEINDERLCYEDPAPGKEVRIYWYPYTPVGFYQTEAETLDAAIDEAMRGSP